MIMSHPQCLPHLVAFDVLCDLSSDRQLYRAYDRLIAATHGTVLVVPQVLVKGRFHDVIDGCPVPWEEVYSIIELPVKPFVMDLASMPAVHAQLDRLDCLGLDHGQWEFDLIGIHDDSRRNIIRFIHASGVRYAVAAQFVV